jgi:hypothetical protein
MTINATNCKIRGIRIGARARGANHPNVYDVNCRLPAAECVDSLNKTRGFISDDGLRCCIARHKDFNLSDFLGKAGGNFISAYGMIRYFAKYMLWCNDIEVVALGATSSAERHRREDINSSLIPA